jgi:flagellar biosynthesis/type III secretory pathway chaperone
MSQFVEAADQLRQVLDIEAAAARQAQLLDLVKLVDRKRQAVTDLANAGVPETEAERTALASMLRSAEENALVLGAVEGALQTVRERLRQDVSAAADPGLYGPPAAGRRPKLRHTLAAQLDHSA